jgi:hypothetical protein
MELRNGSPALVVIDMNRTVGGLRPASIIAAGGGNIIASGGGNIIAAGGGNIIAAGGGNYHVMAADTKVEVPLPNGMLIRVRK